MKSNAFHLFLSTWFAFVWIKLFNWFCNSVYYQWIDRISVHLFRSCHNRQTRQTEQTNTQLCVVIQSQPQQQHFLPREREREKKKEFFCFLIVLKNENNQLILYIWLLFKVITHMFYVRYEKRVFNVEDERQIEIISSHLSLLTVLPAQCYVLLYSISFLSIDLSGFFLSLEGV